jgi:hypothetical protein
VLSAYISVMCGRFTRYYTWAEIHRLYRLTAPASNFQPRYNICPTTDVDTVVPAFEHQELTPMRWGLVPSWWSKPLKEMKLGGSYGIFSGCGFRGKGLQCSLSSAAKIDTQDIPQTRKPPCTRS